jgi:hypothetical protein
MSIHGWCPKCEEEIEFDGGSTVSGPGIQSYVEILDIIAKPCACPLTDDEIDAARERAATNWIAYMTEGE